MRINDALTLSEASEETGISKQTIVRYVKLGYVSGRHAQTTGTWIVDGASLRRLIENRPTRFEVGLKMRKTKK